VIESTTVRAHRIVDTPAVGFSAFLDGAQERHVVHYADGVPIVFGRSAAVVRQRVLRRMVTWKPPMTSARFYMPRALVPSAGWNLVRDHGYEITDTSDDAELAGDVSSAHPFSISQRALEAVQRDRERLERSLAESWCVSQAEPVFIDGSIAGSDRVATAPCAVGVIKSHRTLYVSGDAMRVVQSLAVNHRSSVIRVEAYHRTPVASWYLRVRDAKGQDPMWGLLRVEMAMPDAAERIDAISDRADRISRWILAEMMPLSLPDSRWDKMVYGIRDCEEFLKSVRR
jgi:hypothetical protein